MKTIKFLFTAVIIGLTLTSCNKDNDEIIDVDFEAKFEQLAIGSFGLESAFATLELNSNKGYDAWNTNGSSYSDMLAKYAPSAKATGTDGGFIHQYFDKGTITLSDADKAIADAGTNQVYAGYFVTPTGVDGVAESVAWTPYLGSTGTTGYAYALQPGDYDFEVAQIGTVSDFGNKLGFAATITDKTLVSGTNTSTTIDLVYSQLLVTLVFQTAAEVPSTINIKGQDSDNVEVNGTFTVDPNNDKVVYVYSTTTNIDEISFGFTTYDSSSLTFTNQRHHNFNVTFNATGGFTINPGGQWPLTESGDITGI